MTFIPAARNLFITPAYLKRNLSFIQQNVSDEVLETCIRTTEDMVIHERIGSRMMGTVQTQIAIYMTGGTMNSDYKTLIDDYISPALMWYTVLEYIPFTQFKFRNKGIQVQNSDNSTPADLPDLTYLANQVQAKAMYYGDRLIKYLKNNTSIFTEYCTSESGDIKPANGDTSCGIYIPGMNRTLGGDCSYGLGITTPLD